MKFATKLLLGLSGTILIGATTMITVGGGQTAKLLEKQLVARLEDNAYHMIVRLDQYLYERLLDSERMMADPAFPAATGSPEQILRYLREFLRWGGRYSSAAFYTSDWVVVADTASRRVGVQEALEDCKTNLQTGIDFAVCIGRDSPEDEPTIRLASVARDNDGVASGVLVIRLPMRVLGDHLREFSGSGDSTSALHIDLVDKRGVYLYSKHESTGTLHKTSPDWAFLKEKVRSGQASGSLRYTNPKETTGEEILVYVREQGFREFAGSAWTLILFVPTREVFGPVHEMQLRMATVVLGNAALMLTLLFLLVRSFTRPIVVLGQAAREIGEGNLEVRVPAGSRDELGLFAETFNSMAADLQKSQSELKAVNQGLERLVEERTAELLHTNESLHAELSERVKAQEALVVRERLLRLDADIGEALTIGGALPAVLQLCAGHIVRDLDVAFVRIWTPGDKQGVLELKASAGMYTRIDGEHSRKIVGQLKIGIIAREQRPILTNAVIGDHAITDQEWARREGMVAFAGHPLVVDGKTQGVMALFSRRSLEPFVLEALGIVADKIAIFIGRKQAEESLRISEQRYRELFESSRDGIFTTDAAGVFTSINQAGARMFGLATPADIIGSSSLDFWRDTADREAYREKLRREKSVSAYPISARKKDGVFLKLEATSRILEDENGAFLGIEGMLRDVTQRIKAEAEQALLIAELQEAAANIRTLSGLLPICAGCKKIRDDKGSWRQIETYIKSHSEVEFTHGLCPECQKVYFPGRGAKT